MGATRKKNGQQNALESCIQIRRHYCRSARFFSGSPQFFQVRAGGRSFSAPITCGGTLSSFIFYWAFFRAGIAAAERRKGQQQCQPEKKLRKKPKPAKAPPPALGARTTSTLPFPEKNDGARERNHKPTGDDARSNRE